MLGSAGAFGEEFRPRGTIIRSAGSGRLKRKPASPCQVARKRMTNDSGATSNSSVKKVSIQSLTIRH